MKRQENPRIILMLTLALTFVAGEGCFTPGRKLTVTSSSYSWSSSRNAGPALLTKEVVDKGEKEPLGLEESVAIALSNNRRVLVSDLDIGIAEDEIRQAFSVFLPRLRISAQRSWRDLPPGGRFGPASFTIGDKRVDAASANLLVPLYDFRSIEVYRQKIYRRDVTEYRANRTRQDIILDTVRAYFAILDAKKAVALIAKSVSTLESQLKISRDFQEQGLVGKEDVLQAELRLTEREQELITARNSLDIAVSTFNRALGLDINRETEVCDVLRADDLEIPLRDCFEAAYAHRPDREQLLREHDIAKTEISVARAERYPKLYATLNYDYTSNSFILPDDFTSATLNMQIDPFKGGEILARARKAKKQLRRLQVQLRELDANIALEVKKAHLNVIESRKRIDVSEKAIEHAEENLRIETDKYKQNLVTLTDVLDAETTLLNARNNYNRSLYDNYIAIAELENAMGAGVYELQDAK